MNGSFYQRPDLLVLFNGAYLLHGENNQTGLTGVSLVATPQWLAVVPHASLNVLPTGWPSFSRGDARAFEQAWRQWLDSGVPTAEVERFVVQAAGPDLRFELARQQAYHVRGRTFAAKLRGAWTYDSMGIVSPDGARLLRAFLDAHRSAVAAAVAELPPPELANRGRVRGVLVTLLAVVLFIAGLVPWLLGVPYTTLLWVVAGPLFGQGAFTVIVGDVVDRHTGRPPARTQNLRGLSMVVCGVLGVTGTALSWALPLLLD